MYKRQAYETNGLVITSGQLPVNPADGAMPEGIAAQAEWSCRNAVSYTHLSATPEDKLKALIDLDAQQGKLCA